MKLTKFEVEKLPVEEMSAIKAGSGWSSCGGKLTYSDSGESDSAGSDDDQGG